MRKTAAPRVIGGESASGLWLFAGSLHGGSTRGSLTQLAGPAEDAFEAALRTPRDASVPREAPRPRWRATPGAESAPAVLQRLLSPSVQPLCVRTAAQVDGWRQAETTRTPRPAAHGCPSSAKAQGRLDWTASARSSPPITLGEPFFRALRGDSAAHPGLTRSQCPTEAAARRRPFVSTRTSPIRALRQRGSLGSQRFPPRPAAVRPCRGGSVGGGGVLRCGFLGSGWRGLSAREWREAGGV